MKILFLNQYYWPDQVATAQILSDLCSHLAKMGYEAHVLCSRGHFEKGSTNDPPRPLLPSEATHRGVHIHRVGATSFGRRSLLLQSIDFLSFHLLAGLRTMLTGSRYDLIVSLTTPPFIAVYGSLISSLSQTRHVCWIMNIHPDCAVELGVLGRRNISTNFLDRLNRAILRRANACVALGDCQARRVIGKGVDAARVVRIPLWGLPMPAANSKPESNPLREQLHLQDKFVVMYSGNASMEYMFDDLCGAALLLRDDPRFEFLFVGGGRKIPEIRDFCQQNRLAKVRFLPRFDRENLRDLLTLADVHFVCLRPELLGVSVPSKLYGIMAAGRPAVFVGPDACETAITLSKHDCGRVIPPGDTHALTTCLQQLADDRALRERLGQNGRRAFEREFTVDIAAEQWRRLIQQLCPEPRKS